MKIIFLKNHPKDQLRSMDLYHDLLFAGMAEKGHSCSSISPPNVFSRLVCDSRGWKRWIVYLDKFFLFPIFLRMLLRSHKGKNEGELILHIIDHANAVYTPSLKNLPHLVTCHDAFGMRSAFGMEPLRKKNRFGHLYQNKILNGLKKAFRVVCVSEFTERQVIELGVPAKKCTVISNGLNYPYKPFSTNENLAIVKSLLAERGLLFPAEAYVFHLSGNGWYKNRRGVILAFAELVKVLPNAPRLILAGKPVSEENLELIEEQGIGENVLHCPNCSTEELNALYGGAKFLFFPSVREGFGWPIIEAQASGGLVITSDRAPMNEVGGDAAIYCEPPPLDGKNLSEWASRVARDTLLPALQMNDEKRHELVERGLSNSQRFSTEKMISDFESLYRKILSEHE